MHIFTVISYFYWYRTFMKFIWDFFVPNMELLWNLFGTFLEFLWDSNVEFLWNFFGTPMVIWLPKKFNVEFLWNFFGIYLDHFYLLGMMTKKWDALYKIMLTILCFHLEFETSEDSLKMLQNSCH